MRVLLLLLGLFFPGFVAAQGPDQALRNVDPPSAASATVVAATNSTDYGMVTSKTPYEMWIILLLFAFAVFVIWIVYLIYRENKDFDQKLFMQTFTISLVILAAIFLIVAGYSNQQIAPAFGLLGSIAGYVMGRSTAEAEKKPEPAPPPAPPSPPPPNPPAQEPVPDASGAGDTPSEGGTEAQPKAPVPGNGQG